MIFEYTDKDYNEITVEAKRLEVQDSSGNRYRIKENKFGGIEVLAEDGKISIEPNVSNLIVLKTID